MNPVLEYQNHIHYTLEELSNAEKVLIKKQDLILTRSTIENLSKIIYLIFQQEHLLLVGDAGIGKNALIYYINSIRKMPTIRFSFNQDTSIEDLIGSYHIEQDSFIWKDGPLLQAMKKGFTFVADELNLAKPQILKRFSSIWSQRTIVLSEKDDEEVIAQPTFSFVATQNPSYLFEGRKELTENIRKYFTTLHLQQYTEEENLEILSNLYPKIPLKFIQLIVNTQTIIENYILPNIVHKENILEHYCFNLRSSKRFLERIQTLKKISTNNVFSNLYEHTFIPFEKHLHSHFKKSLFKIWSSSLKITVEALEELYQKEGTFYYDHKELPLVFFESITIPFPLTIQRRNILHKIHTSVQNNENLLLEGSSTSRIYELLKAYALSRKKKIHLISLTENTQTSDLFGSLKPSKNGIAWNSGSITKALESEDWIIFENIEATNSDLLEKLNMLLDDASSILIKNPQGNIKLLQKSKNSRIFAIKQIRKIPLEKTISRAFRNRFHTIYIHHWLDNLNFYHESMQQIASCLYGSEFFETLNPLLNTLIQFHCYLKEQIQKNTLSKDMQEKPILIEETLIKVLMNYMQHIHTSIEKNNHLQQQIEIYYCSLFRSQNEQDQILKIWNSFIQEIPIQQINEQLNSLIKKKV